MRQKKLLGTTAIVTLVLVLAALTTTTYAENATSPNCILEKETIKCQEFQHDGTSVSFSLLNAGSKSITELTITAIPQGCELVERSQRFDELIAPGEKVPVTLSCQSDAALTSADLTVLYSEEGESVRRVVTGALG